MPTPGDVARLRQQPDMPPTAQYMLREYLAAWNLRPKFPGVWNTLIGNWASATGTDATAYEQEAMAWEAEWQQARRQGTSDLKLNIRPVAGQGLDIMLATHHRTADLGPLLQIEIHHPAGTLVKEPPALFWTTHAQPTPDARRRIRGRLVTDTTGTSSTMAFDLRSEPAWRQVAARPLRLAVRVRLSQEWAMKALTMSDSE